MRVILMLLGLVLFLAIWAWSWSSRRREAFDEAARLPFAEDADDASGLRTPSSPGRPQTTTPPRGAGAAGALGVTQGEER